MKFKTIFEGMYDPVIFKAIFLAGGPGSGKSYIIKKLSFLGFVILNSDKMFEYLMKKNNLDLKMPDDEKEIRNKSKSLTSKSKELILDGRLGIIVDGTGWNFSKIEIAKNKLEKMGYETAMILVNTNIETALKRNEKRNRTVPQNILLSRHKQVQENIGKFQQSFEDHFYLIDNSDNVDNSERISRIYKIMMKWSKILPKNKLINQWIAYEKKKKRNLN